MNKIHEIPIVHLKTELDENIGHYSESILENEINGIAIEHVVIIGRNEMIDTTEQGCKTIYLIISGSGSTRLAHTEYELLPETILVPNNIDKITITVAQNANLNYLKISCKLSAEDLKDLEGFPPENTQNVYYAKFSDCQSYTEPIKSPNTVSRTIFPNKIIPRVAMGTVETKGPDEVGAHEHAMLEQLFLGLSKNKCTVYADDRQVDFPQNALLHIPLGSRHSVSVEKDETLHYVWMDFFLNKEGEEWLMTHQIDED